MEDVIKLKGGRIVKKSYLTHFVVLIFSILLIGCQAHTPQVSYPPFQSVDLDSKLSSGGYRQKADNFVAILDASRSVGDAEGGRTQFEMARNFLYRMNQTLPNVPVSSALRSFGHWRIRDGQQTILHYGPTSWSRGDFQAALDAVPWGAGASPVDQAFDNASQDMASMTGPTAVILVGDGQYDTASAVAAAERMKTRYGEDVCIFTVLVGTEGADTVQTMTDIANVGGCGFFGYAGELESPQAMASWVESVFWAKGAAPAPMDSDGDGVADGKDACPGTPRGVTVDSKGCPLDSDGDGVYDYLDKCPNTPMGATVDARGCWVIRGINFNTGESLINPVSYRLLDEVADILARNPTLKVEIQGHTDNRGSAAFNRKLSEKRANAVLDYLVQKGVSRDRLTAAGYGFSRPAASNDTPEGRAQNRRVELKPMR
jgi:OOP family OmpA-OmpF porin